MLKALIVGMKQLLPMPLLASYCFFSIRQNAIDFATQRGLFGVHPAVLLLRIPPFAASAGTSIAAGRQCWSSAAAWTLPSAGSPSSIAPGGRFTLSTAAASGAVGIQWAVPSKAITASGPLRQCSEALHALQ